MPSEVLSGSWGSIITAYRNCERFIDVSEGFDRHLGVNGLGFNKPKLLSYPVMEQEALIVLRSPVKC